MEQARQITCELWRLGLLLSGDEAGAERALRRVLLASDSVLKLSAERRLRLLVAGARTPDAVYAAPAAPGDELRAAMAGLEALPRACWILRDVQGLSDVQTARAVGLSRPGVEQYAQQARQRLQGALGDNFFSAIDALKRSANEADPAPSIARVSAGLQSVRRRRRIIAALQISALAVVLALLAWVGIDLKASHQREAEQLRLLEDLSAPGTDSDAQRREQIRRERQGPAAGRELPGGRTR